MSGDTSHSATTNPERVPFFGVKKFASLLFWAFILAFAALVLWQGYRFFHTDTSSNATPSASTPAVQATATASPMGSTSDEIPSKYVVCGKANKYPDPTPIATAPDADADPEGYRVDVGMPDLSKGACTISVFTADPSQNGKYGIKCKDYDGVWHQLTPTYSCPSYQAITFFKRSVDDLDYVSAYVGKGKPPGKQ